MLQGTLEEFALSALIPFLSAQSKTGELQVSHPGASGRIGFNRGDVALAAIEGRRASARTDAAATIEEIEACVTEMAGWSDGEFVWAGGPAPVTDPVVRVDAGALMHAIDRRQRALEELRGRLSSPATVLVISATPPEGAEEINISAKQWRLLALIDGVRTIGEIATRADSTPAEIGPALYELAGGGLIETIEAETAPAILDEPAPLEGVSSQKSGAHEPVPHDDEPAPTAFRPGVDVPRVDRAAAVRELAGLSQEQGTVDSFESSARLAAAYEAHNNDESPESRGFVARLRRKG